MKNDRFLGDLTNNELTIDLRLVTGQKFPAAICWIPSLNSLATTGFSYDITAIRDLTFIPEALFDAIRHQLVKVLDARLFIYDRQGTLVDEKKLPNISQQVLDMASFNRGIAILEKGSRLVKVYNNNFQYSRSLSFPLDPANTNPAAITWNGAAFVVLDMNGRFYFYGNERTRSVVAGLTGFFPKKQFTNYFRASANKYDIYRRAGSRFVVIEADVELIPQTKNARIDFSGVTDIQDQQKVFDMIPKYIIQDIKIGDIILPHAIGVIKGSEVEVLPTAANLEVDGITIVGNEYQSFVCNEII